MSPQLAETVFDLTDGNPLFVSHMTRLLSQDSEYQEYYHDGLTADGTRNGARSAKYNRVQLPEAVREVIGRRLNHLSERCNGILTIAAVLVAEFRLRELLFRIKLSKA